MSFSASPSDQPLAVEGKIEHSAEQKAVQKSLKWNALFKWLVAILLFFSVLTSLVVSKLSLLSIAMNLKRPGAANSSEMTPRKPSWSIDRVAPEPVILEPSDNSIGNYSQIGSLTSVKYEADVAYVMLVLFMLIPHFVSFLRSFIRSACSSTQLWPTKKSIVAGVLCAVCEVGGLCLFTLIVIPKLRNAMRTIFLMNGVFLVPLLYIMVDQLRQLYSNHLSSKTKINHVATQPLNINPADPYSRQQSCESGTTRKPSLSSQLVTILLYTFSALMSLAGFTVLLFGVNSLLEYVCIPLSILLCSVAWLPQLQEFQIKAKTTNSTTSGASNSRLVSLKSSLRNARYRMTLISSSVKLVLTFAFAYGLKELNMTGTKNTDSPLINGFHHFLDDKRFVWTFAVHILSGMIGKLGTWVACKVNLQRSCFVIPFLLSTPIAITLVSPPVSKAYGTCNLLLGGCPNEGDPDTLQTILLGVLLYVSGLSFNIQFFKSKQFLMAKDEVLFWLPGYNGVFLEQHIILNRKNEITDTDFVNYKDIVRKSHVYICTTMYHEADFEMEQLIRSLAEIDDKKKESPHHIEAHVFFDDGVRGTTIKNYALQLLSLFKSTIGVDPSNTTKMETPYGLQLKYALKNGMPFVLHLKDKLKVKSKKRWSQVMYMSYILDYKGKKSNDDLSYLLATDADVKFTYYDVMALMDSMSCDPSIAAVCGRTHPMGSGPMVWYQVFDYAVGHWLGKVSNHVLGTVLCSPGCFSLYRATAVRNVLSMYASSVNSPMDFLTKDMGEDRWFCTLLVEQGWKLEYCAIAANSTYCPDTFDEFFKQRRRWGPSTFANLVKVLNKQGTIRQNNNYINIFFIGFQLVQMMSSVINPSTILLFMAAGLQYAYPLHFNMIGVLVVLVVITISFALVCMYFKPDTQLKVAKVLSFIFAIAMCITTVGCFLQIVDTIKNGLQTQQIDLSSDNVSTTSIPIEKNMMGTTTLYILIMVAIYVVTGLLHGTEALTLLYGILYWLALPTGYLLLTIYSIANLTDRSWGTREQKESSVSDVETSWKRTIIVYFKYFCWCCVPPQLRNNSLSEELVNENDEMDDQENDGGEFSLTEDDESDNEYMDPADLTGTKLTSMKNDPINVKAQISIGENRPVYGNLNYDDKKEGRKGGNLASPVQLSVYQAVPRPPPSPRGNHRTTSTLAGLKKPKRLPQYRNITMSKKQTLMMPKRRSVLFTHALTVEDWLTSLQYQEYVKNFQDSGFDNVSFIAGSISEKDLVDMGITNQGHRKKLLANIEYLPPVEQSQDVPEDVERWLINLGLEKYWSEFRNAAVEETKDLAQLKTMTDEQLSERFHITKRGHLKKLSEAVKYLQYATKSQKLIRETREKMSIIRTQNLNEDIKEAEFWERLRKFCLLPEQDAFNQSTELGDKLAEMRVSCFVLLLVVNTLWLVFIVTIMSQGPKLHLMGESFVGVAFTFLYALILLLQFFSLLVHRVDTLVHYIARASIKLTSNRDTTDNQTKDVTYQWVAEYSA